MNASPGDDHERGILPLLMSMIGTRVELAAIDAEAHVQGAMSRLLRVISASMHAR